MAVFQPGDRVQAFGLASGFEEYEQEIGQVVQMISHDEVQVHYQFTPNMLFVPPQHLQRVDGSPVPPSHGRARQRPSQPAGPPSTVPLALGGGYGAEGVPSDDRGRPVRHAEDRNAGRVLADLERRGVQLPVRTVQGATVRDPVDGRVLMPEEVNIDNLQRSEIVPLMHFRPPQLGQQGQPPVPVWYLNDIPWIPAEQRVGSGWLKSRARFQMKNNTPTFFCDGYGKKNGQILLAQPNERWAFVLSDAGLQGANISPESLNMYTLPKGELIFEKDTLIFRKPKAGVIHPRSQFLHHSSFFANQSHIYAAGLMYIKHRRTGAVVVEYMPWTGHYQEHQNDLGMFSQIMAAYFQKKVRKGQLHQGSYREVPPS